MVAITPRIEEIARMVAKAIREHLGRTVRVVWFGSWVKGSAAPRSDLDIALDAGSVIDATRMVDLRDAVEELPTLYKIDLVDLNRIDSGFRQRILAEGRDL